MRDRENELHKYIQIRGRQIFIMSPRIRYRFRLTTADTHLIAMTLRPHWVYCAYSALSAPQLKIMSC